MIESLHPYVEWKRTGLPWLPTIPAHWEVRQVTDFVLVNWTELYTRADVAELRRQSPRLAAE